MTSPLKLSVPNSFFSLNDCLEQADAIQQIKDQLIELSLQQFAFELKDFLMAHRDIDGFMLRADEGIEGALDDMIDVYQIDLVDQEDSKDDSYRLSLKRELLMIIDEKNEDRSLIASLIENDWSAKFQNLSQANEEQLLSIVMSQMLGPESFSIWEGHYLKSQATLTLPTAKKPPAKKPHHSL